MKKFLLVLTLTLFFIIGVVFLTKEPPIKSQYLDHIEKLENNDTLKLEKVWENIYKNVKTIKKEKADSKKEIKILSTQNKILQKEIKILKNTDKDTVFIKIADTLKIIDTVKKVKNFWGKTKTIKNT